VRDAYLTGDVTRSTFTIIVDEAPIIHEIITIDEIYVGVSVALDANISDLESDAGYIVWRDHDVYDGLDTDHDERISSGLLIRWEYDIDKDANDNGITDDDWMSPSGADGIRLAASWDEVGTSTLRLSVCDGMGMCTEMLHEVTVLDKEDEPPSLSDFSMQDWKNWLVDASGESMVILALIAAVLILGWTMMRSPSEVEEEAESAAKTYEVEEVQSYGGVLGMDQHNPPPVPKILSKDERRNDSSGYVRPLRRRH
jgi:hypothetical protein